MIGITSGDGRRLLHVSTVVSVLIALAALVGRSPPHRLELFGPTDLSLSTIRKMHSLFQQSQWEKKFNEFAPTGSLHEKMSAAGMRRLEPQDWNTAIHIGGDHMSGQVLGIHEEPRPKVKLNTMIHGDGIPYWQQLATQFLGHASLKNYPRTPTFHVTHPVSTRPVRLVGGPADPPILVAQGADALRQPRLEPVYYQGNGEWPLSIAGSSTTRKRLLLVQPGNDPLQPQEFSSAGMDQGEIQLNDQTPGKSVAEPQSVVGITVPAEESSSMYEVQPPAVDWSQVNRMNSVLSEIQYDHAKTELENQNLANELSQVEAAPLDTQHADNQSPPQVLREYTAPTQSTLHEFLLPPQVVHHESITSSPPFGWNDVIKMKNDLKRMQKQLERTQQQNIALQKQILSLNGSRHTIKKQDVFDLPSHLENPNVDGFGQISTLKSMVESIQKQQDATDRENLRLRRRIAAFKSLVSKHTQGRYPRVAPSRINVGGSAAASSTASTSTVPTGVVKSEMSNQLGAASSKDATGSGVAFKEAGADGEGGGGREEEYVSRAQYRGSSAAVKERVVAALAADEEASMQADTDAIFGNAKPVDEEQDTPRDGFRHLHSLETRVLDGSHKPSHSTLSVGAVHPHAPAAKAADHVLVSHTDRVASARHRLTAKAHATPVTAQATARVPSKAQLHALAVVKHLKLSHSPSLVDEQPQRTAAAALVTHVAARTEADHGKAEGVGRRGGALGEAPAAGSSQGGGRGDRRGEEAELKRIHAAMRLAKMKQRALEFVAALDHIPTQSRH